MIRNTQGKGNDLFATPDHLFNQLNARFKFTLDAACEHHNMKCPSGYPVDKGLDGLTGSWAGQRVFCNPPFSQKSAWIQKAVHEVEENNCPVCVMILPSNSVSSSFFHDYIFGKYLYEILKGRVSFIGPDKKPVSGNDSGTIIVYFWKKTTAKASK